MSVKTSWEHLANLGWPKQHVYDKANEERGGTMEGLGDIFLNDGIAAQYEWWSYNELFGRPYVSSRERPKITPRKEIAWSYDNRENSEPFVDTWTESWTNTSSATLTVEASLTIGIHASITIPDVASMGYDLTVVLGMSHTATKEQSYQLSHNFEAKVAPYEKLTILRVITTESEEVAYTQEFGIRSGSLLGTKGRLYDGHYYWGMDINRLLDYPRGRLTLRGRGQSTSYQYKLIREGPNGRTTEPVPIYGNKARLTGEVPTAVLEGWEAQTRLTIGEGIIKDAIGVSPAA